MFSKDLSIYLIFIAGQSNFETALATCCGPLKLKICDSGPCAEKFAHPMH